jgi:hypothetical protein
MVFSSSRTLPRHSCAARRWNAAAESARGQPVHLRVVVREMLPERGDVAAALAQRRQAEADDIEAEEQVFAEAAGADLRRQIAVGGGEDAYIHPHRLRTPDAVDLALLHGAQQLGLQAQLHLANLVEQERAPVGRFELAHAPRERAAERALLGWQHTSKRHAECSAISACYSAISGRCLRLYGIFAANMVWNATGRGRMLRHLIVERRPSTLRLESVPCTRSEHWA